MAGVNHVVKDRNGRPREESRCDRSGHQGECQSLKDGIGKNDICADDDGCRSQEHGAETSGSRIDHRIGQRNSLANTEFDEVDKNNRVADNDILG
jgi:hypothetical protein